MRATIIIVFVIIILVLVIINSGKSYSTTLNTSSVQSFGTMTDTKSRDAATAPTDLFDTTIQTSHQPYKHRMFRRTPLPKHQKVRFAATRLERMYDAETGGIVGEIKNSA